MKNQEWHKEAREAEIHDQMTRLKTAREEGMAQGIAQGMNKGITKGVAEKAVRIAEKMLKRGDNIDDITELTKEEILELKKKYQN